MSVSCCSVLLFRLQQMERVRGADLEVSNFKDKYNMTMLVHDQKSYVQNRVRIFESDHERQYQLLG